MKHTLAHPALLEINIPDGGTAIGGSQEWYREKWQRMSGCGPTAASNLIWYLARSRPGLRALCDASGVGKEDFLGLMGEVFTFVTPGMGGVNTASLFTSGAIRYGEAHSIPLISNVLEIPGMPCNRPKQDTLREFILTALQADLPLAFLNLSNGTLTDLESWHWVTIIALDDDALLATISDQGRIFDIDLSEWLRSAVLGGAFVYLDVHGK